MKLTDSNMNASTSTSVHPQALDQKWFWLAVFLLFSAALYFRASGLFHGLPENVVFHPDTPKQMATLENYLRDIRILYAGNLFHDGYPYGLNLVDEGLIRLSYLVYRPVHFWLYGDGRSLEFPGRSDLYAWARVLRLLYGMASVVLVSLCLSLLTQKRGIILMGTAIAALSPLGPTVTHSASGDVGVDLFIAFVLFFLALSTRRQKDLWLIPSGMAAGMAFACKYQGGLGALMVAIFLLARQPAPWKSPVKFLLPAFTSALGFFAGVFALTPGLWVDPKTTWRLMRENFTFIKNYNTPAEYLEKDLFEKVAWSLTHNLLMIVGVIGLLLVLASVAALIVGIRQRTFPKQTEDDDHNGPDPKNLPAFLIAVSAYSLIALLLSTLLKPVIQPFHFSYLPIPLAVSAALLAHICSRKPSKLRTWPAIGLTLVLLGMYTGKLIEEDYFWRRGAMRATYRVYGSETQTPPLLSDRNLKHRRSIKRFYLHPPGLPVFRNEPRVLLHPRAGWWRENHQLPLPSIPLQSDPPHWMFVNGAIFPRNDRYLYLPEGRQRDTRLVFEDSGPETVTLGFRSGRVPVHLKGSLGHAPFEISMPPHDQTQITLRLTGPEMRQPGGDAAPDISIYRLRIKNHSGAAVAAVLATELCVRSFKAFGPEGADIDLPEMDDLARQLAAALRFWAASTTPLSPGQPLVPLNTPPFLPAGRYRLHAKLVNHGEVDHPVTFSYRDPSRKQPEAISPAFTIPPGQSDLEWTFDKAYAPHEIKILFHETDADLLLLDWTLKPVPGRPEAFDPPKEPPSSMPVAFVPFDIEYDGQIKLTGIHFGFDPKNPKRIQYAVQAKGLPDLTDRNFREWVIFLHLVDEAGKIVNTLDIPVSTAVFRPDRFHPHEKEIEPGERERITHLRMGIYSARKRVRIPPNPLHLPAEAQTLRRDQIQLLSIPNADAARN